MLLNARTCAIQMEESWQQQIILVCYSASFFKLLSVVRAQPHLLSVSGLSIEEIVKLIMHLGNATAYADTAIARFQATRLDEIDILTTHVSVSPGWHLATNQTSPPTAKPSTAGPPT